MNVVERLLGHGPGDAHPALVDTGHARDASGGAASRTVTYGELSRLVDCKDALVEEYGWADLGTRVRI